MTEPAMKVLIDIYDESNIFEETDAAGCTIVLESSSGIRSKYIVSGPKDALLSLLKDWGYYDDSDYKVLT